MEAEKTVGQNYRQTQGDFGGDEHTDYLDHSKGCKTYIKMFHIAYQFKKQDSRGDHEA